MKDDWFEVIHPGVRAKDRKPKVKPLANQLASWFAAEYGDQIPKAQAA